MEWPEKLGSGYSKNPLMVQIDLKNPDTFKSLQVNTSRVKNNEIKHILPS